VLFLGRDLERRVAVAAEDPHARTFDATGSPVNRLWHHLGVRILLIEDDDRLAERTAEYLQTHKAKVEIVNNGERGLERAASGEHDLVLLDLMLPGVDGLDLCRKLRQRSKVPVIILSARGEEVDRIVGLEVGADDYMPKPFSPRELLARIRAVLRRHAAGGDASAEMLSVGPLEIDRARRAVMVASKPCELTAYQFDLLWVLASQAERVLSRNQLHAQVRALRGESPQEFDPTVDRSIDVHLSKVRQAIAAADPTGAGLIKTIRGVGYVLSPEAAADGSSDGSADGSSDGSADEVQ
jgi:DNA-binding response OmpR family regulator